MNAINYYASYIFEVREDNDVEMLESTMYNSQPEAYISDELPFLEDIVLENHPKELGLYKRLEYGTIIYTKDYWGEWDVDVEIQHEKITKFSDSEMIDYLKKFETQ